MCIINLSGFSFQKRISNYWLRRRRESSKIKRKEINSNRVIKGNKRIRSRGIIIKKVHKIKKRKIKNNSKKFKKRHKYQKSQKCKINKLKIKMYLTINKNIKIKDRKSLLKKKRKEAKEGKVSNNLRKI